LELVVVETGEPSSEGTTR